MLNEHLKTKTNPTFYDVGVCGGGIAGISSALSASRQGKKVVLFERSYMLGGLATAGLITIYLPLCDGMGNQVSFGIAEELFRLSIKYGAEDRYPKNWIDGKGKRTQKDKRFEVQYNPQLFGILAEQLLVQNGVDIMYGTYVVGVDKPQDKIEHLIVENKSGRSAYKVKSVVDATGDCDIGKFASVPIDEFNQGNILASWYYFIRNKKYTLRRLGFCDIPEEEKKVGQKMVYLSDKRYSGLDGKELSQMTIDSHKSVLNDFLIKRKASRECWITTIATTPQIRMTRKVVGEYVLSHTEERTYFEDSIGLISNWKERGPIYEVPFRTLYSKKVKNLIFAGRCVSTNQTMWDIMRVIPCCAVTGEAAGIAATMTDDFSSLKVQKLQSELVKNGVVLHVKEIIKN